MPSRLPPAERATWRLKRSRAVIRQLFFFWLGMAGVWVVLVRSPAMPDVSGFCCGTNSLPSSRVLSALWPWILATVAGSRIVMAAIDWEILRHFGEVNEAKQRS